MQLSRSEHPLFLLGRPESIVRSCCILPCEFGTSSLVSDPSCLISGILDKIIYVKVLALSVGRGKHLINSKHTWNDCLLSLWPSIQNNKRPKDVRLLIPNICDSVSLGDKRDSAHMIKLKTLTWGDDPGFSADL